MANIQHSGSAEHHKIVSIDGTSREAYNRIVYTRRHPFEMAQVRNEEQPGS